jgi:hypothetical protein
MKPNHPDAGAPVDAVPQSPTPGADKAGSPATDPPIPSRMPAPHHIDRRPPPSGSAGPASRRFGPWLVLLLSLTLTAGLWLFERHEIRRTEQARFDAATGEIAHQFEQRLVASEIVVRAAASIAAARQHELTEDEWERFVDGLDLNATTFDGTTGLGLALRVEPGELDAHVAQMRRTRPGYAVVPPGVREVHVPLVGLKQIDTSTWPAVRSATTAGRTRRVATPSSVPRRRAPSPTRGHSNRQRRAPSAKATPSCCCTHRPSNRAPAPRAATLTIHDLHALTVTRIRLAPLLAAAGVRASGIAVTLSIPDLSGKPVVVATHPGGRLSRDIPPGTVTLRRGGIDFTLRIAALPTFHTGHDDPLRS